MKKILSLVLSTLLIINYTAMSCLAQTIKVKSGTTIPLVFDKEHTSKNTLSGSTIEGKIAQDVIVDNVVIFKKDDKASLNITKVKKAGFVGNPGEMLITNGQVYDASGREHLMEYSQYISGEEKTYPKVLLGVSIFFLFPLAFFGFVKGGQAEVPAYVPINTKLSQDFDFEVQN